MRLVVGGIASGKRTYARSLGFREDELVLDVHELARACYDVGALADDLSAKEVVTCCEVGSGIVPLDADERAWRERVGALLAALAERADVVVRMVCGIPVVLKGSLSLESQVEGGLPTAARRTSFLEPACLYPAAQAANPPQPEIPNSAEGVEDIEFVLIRHGRTPGNEARQYVGVLDQPLSETGRAQAAAAGAHPDVARVYVSVMRRAQETAAIMFPNAEQVVVEGVHEMDFGAFAGRSADDMVDDAEYRAWVDGECKGTCPGGESQHDLIERVCAALEALLLDAASRGERQVVMVAHGGTMMSFLDHHVPGQRKYWEWLVGNCEGYRIGVSCAEGSVKVNSIEKLAE